MKAANGQALTLGLCIAGFGLLSSGILWLFSDAGPFHSVLSPECLLLVPMVLGILLSGPAVLIFRAITPAVMPVAEVKTVSPGDERQKDSEAFSPSVRSLIENAADVICVIDVQGKFLQANPASSTIWGYKPAELIGRDLKDFLENDEGALNAILGGENSMDQIHFENRFRRKSGDVVDMLWSARWSASDGGLFCVAHNITERKRAEQLVRESEEKIRGILENLPAGVALIGRSGVLEFMNKTGCSLTGFEVTDDITGARASEVFSFCKEPFFVGQLDAIIGSQDGSAKECFITKRTGERFAAEASISRLNLGRENSGLVIFLDTSIKHQVERAKREFVAMVSHDLRSPLTSITMILGYLAMGKGGELNSSGESMANRAKDECNRLMKLIQDLLDLEKMKSGKFSMHCVETDLNKVIQSSVDAVDSFRLSHGVQIAIASPGDLMCVCDGARIIQVIVNLLDNAIKYSSPGSDVKIEVEDGDGIRIAVSNGGRAIPADKLASIFERFEQVEESDASERKGTGLGLAICKTIAEQHGGRIWVESSGNRTTFYLALPKSEVPLS